MCKLKSGHPAASYQVVTLLCAAFAFSISFSLAYVWLFAGTLSGQNSFSTIVYLSNNNGKCNTSNLSTSCSFGRDGGEGNFSTTAVYLSTTNSKCNTSDPSTSCFFGSNDSAVPPLKKKRNQPPQQPDKNKSTCTEGPAQHGVFPFSDTVASLRYSPPMNDIRKVRSPPLLMTNASGEAACYFGANTIYKHFPHGMQTLYRCWAFWEEQDMISPLPRAIYFPEHFEPREATNFWGGIVESLANGTNLTVIQPDADSGAQPQNWTKELSKYGGYTIVGQGAFSFLKEDHCHSLRELILSSRRTNKQVNAKKISPAASAHSCNSPPDRPRVVFLKRAANKVRSILNTDALYEALISGLPTANVSLADFAGTSFDEQVRVMSAADVLVTPHGAQMTGMFLMPKCGAVLEIFPAGFGPSYFQTLMRACGLSRRHVYLGMGDMAEETKIHASTREGRSKYRDVKLCVNITVVLETVEELIEERSKCCRKASLPNQ